jgi:prepilin-type N-terminal cleavage/methylation domain-containing protein
MIINKSNILKNGNSTESFACINTCVLHKGFTLIELLVVMAIIAIISSILFSDYPLCSTHVLIQAKLSVEFPFFRILLLLIIIVLNIISTN